MKRNTKQLDKAEIFFLAKRLPQVSDEAYNYVINPFDYCISYKKYGKRAEKAHTYWCGACGEPYNHDELADLRKNPDYNPKTYSGRKTMATCPHCGKTMLIVDSESKGKSYQDVIGVHSTFGEWCVDRFFLLETFTAPNRAERVCLNEVGQSWSREEGRTYMYFKHKGGMFYSKYWKTDSDYHFVNYMPDEAVDCIYWKGLDEYSFPADFSLDKELAKYGIDKNNCHGMPILDIVSNMQCPYFETLWKQGEYKMAKFFKSSLPQYWPQIKIVRRQGYKITDYTKWRDMVDLLRNVRDINSPKYICPRDLEQAHDRAVMLNRKWRSLDELERNKVYDKALRKRIAPFLGMDIQNDNIQVIVLPSVKAFMDEGDHLGHCVYSCGYYKKETSLILSARDKQKIGKRWETIEVDLTNFTIRQCYGYGDKFTKHHNEITDLVKANMWQIRQRMHA